MPAQEILPIKQIPTALTENADIIIQSETVDVVVESVKSAVLEYQIVFTILKPSGDHYRNLELNYDPFISVKKIKAEIFNAAGEKVTTINRNNFADYSANNTNEIFSDSRVLYHKASYPTYPFTIRYSYKVKYSGFVILPFWDVQTDFSKSVLKSSYQLTVPSGYSYRLKLHNLPDSTNTFAEGKKIVKKWEINNLKVLNEEKYIDYNDVFKWMEVAPDSIFYDGHTGNITTWLNYGHFLHNLYNNRTTLPEEVKNEILTLTQKCNSDDEKIKVIYQYMQSRTRYVAISLGIGGWQPFEASFVHSKGFGDCKALSNYTSALLKLVGILSFPSAICSGRYSRIDDSGFSSFGQTNHIILCVPLFNDTLWLECTDQNHPFGYVQRSIADRNTILITPDGGKFVRTPASAANQNLQVRFIEADLNNLGDATA